MISVETIRDAPKVLLHDHLDGGLRPTTVIDLAREFGYRGLPTTDPDELASAFTAGADRKSLVLYLEGFEHTVGVLQTPEALERVAFECAEDLAHDGVVYAEVRYAPELSTRDGLSLDEAVQAILRGFARGERETGIRMGFIATAMRQFARSVEIAELAIRYRDDGVVGFDVAGPEAGYPPTRYLDAFNLIHQANFHLTIHAGRGVRAAVHLGSAAMVRRPPTWPRSPDRRRHQRGPDGQLTMGRLASYVRDQRVPLEMCPTSNVHTGAVDSIEDHPIDLLRRLRFRVTVNTDNRLMSGVTMTSEFETLSRVFDFGLDEMQWLTLNAMKSAFAPFDERLRLINGVIKPGYARLIAESNFAEAAARY